MDPTILVTALALGVVLLVVYIVIRIVLKITHILFTVGCLALIVLAVLCVLGGGLGLLPVGGLAGP